jgi:hypothetical protein
VYAGYGSGINVSRGDAPTTGISSSNYREADAGWGPSGSLSITSDNCGKTTGAGGGLGVKGGDGYGAGGFFGTAWSGTLASPSLGSILGIH